MDRAVRLIILDISLKDHAKPGELLVDRASKTLYIKMNDGVVAELNSTYYSEISKYMDHNLRVHSDNYDGVNHDLIPSMDEAMLGDDPILVFDDTEDLSMVDDIANDKTFERKTVNFMIYDKSLDKVVMLMPNVLIKDVYKFDTEGNKVTITDILDDIYDRIGVLGTEASNAYVSKTQFNEEMANYLIKGDIDTSIYPNMQAIITKIETKKDTSAVDTMISDVNSRIDDVISTKIPDAVKVVDDRLTDVEGLKLDIGTFNGNANTLDDHITELEINKLDRGAFEGSVQSLKEKVDLNTDGISDNYHLITNLTNDKLETGGYVGSAAALNDRISANHTDVTTTLNNKAEKGAYTGSMSTLKTLLESQITEGDHIDVYHYIKNIPVPRWDSNQWRSALSFDIGEVLYQDMGLPAGRSYEVTLSAFSFASNSGDILNVFDDDKYIQLKYGEQRLDVNDVLISDDLYTMWEKKVVDLKRNGWRDMSSFTIYPSDYINSSLYILTESMSAVGGNNGVVGFTFKVTVKEVRSTKINY